MVILFLTMMMMEGQKDGQTLKNSTTNRTITPCHQGMYAEIIPHLTKKSDTSSIELLQEMYYFYTQSETVFHKKDEIS
ncbi:hypothetical protein JTE90_020946 [Oedothorax gibbosus]|uniref:Uncharacterized protein n=1 Tax=Oedothorax gibbosus TaxID=931172 RepID=A0AAV6VQV7_9ARAC|nr:hypothetical protein JTE90_020946 [Oedothorax gibbosus]